MKCAVLNCTSQTLDKVDCSFFSFPLNEELSKKWIKFCRRQKPFNYRTSLICMKHFAKEDILNSFEYEMGFAKKRILKRGVVPTIFKEEFISPERRERAIQRENKRIVKELIKQYDAEHNCTGTEDESTMESWESVDITDSNAPLLQMNNAVETPTSLEPFLETYRTSLEEFEDVETKLHERDIEIKELREVNKRQEKEIAAVKHELKLMRDKTEALEKRVAWAEKNMKTIDVNLAKFFSKNQMAMLKYGTKKPTWTASDLKQGRFLYTTNRKIYKFLLERGFPIPSIRTMQRLLKSDVPTVHLEDHCYTVE